MDDLLNEVIKKLNYRLAFLKKFVDDLITALPESEIENTLEIFNSYDPNLKFTIEKEDEKRSVPFLDTRLYRVEGRIHLNWYKKPTASNKIINYHSDHPMKMKLNSIKEMNRRIEKICHPTFIKKKLQREIEEDSRRKFLSIKINIENIIFNTP